MRRAARFCPSWRWRRSSGGAPDPRRPRSRPSPIDGDLAITNVTVIDVVAGRPLPDQTVVVRGDRIAAVGPADTIRAKEGATIIDGTGQYLIPGLWDMHAHLADPAMPAMFLRHGVTGVRHLFSLVHDLPDRTPADPDRRAAVTSPRVVGGPQMLDGSRSAFPPLLFRRVLAADTPDDARRQVRKLKENRNDFVKVHAALPREAYFAAVAEAKAVGLPVVGHVPYTVTAAEASDAGQLTIEHLDGVAVGCSARGERLWAVLRDAMGGPNADPHAPWRTELDALESFDAKKGDALFRKFVEKGTWHVPTLVEARGKARLGDPRALDPAVEKELPESLAKLWKRELNDGGVRLAFNRVYTKRDLADRGALLKGELKLVGRMHAAKVRLLAGTDTPGLLVVPGLSLHEELELLVEAGLTPVEALRAATANPAACLGMADRLGTVEAGKLADLVLLAKDPLADIRNTRSIKAVLVGGRAVPR